MDLGSGFLYRLLKDLLRWVKGRKGNLSPEDRLASREKWKSVFEEKIAERRRDGLRSDVVVRDVKRLDQYPNIQENEKGISAWFKVGLVGTYHKGIMVQLNWIGIVLDEQGWRLRTQKDPKDSGLTAALIGYVPYENIASVDWEGDEYYCHPQLFCHFDARKGEPYERLAYCERKQDRHVEWYSEIATYEEVKERSRHGEKHGYA